MKTEHAVAHFGSYTALAAALGISKSAVSQWGDDVPDVRQYQLEVVTGGALKAGGRPAGSERRSGSPGRRSIDHYDRRHVHDRREPEGGAAAPGGDDQRAHDERRSRTGYQRRHVHDRRRRDVV